MGGRRSSARAVSAPAVVLALAIAVVIAVIGGALAEGTVITACVHDTRGSLRVVGDASQCHAQESALTWNQQGPPGPPGERGSQGEPGDPAPAQPDAGGPRIDANAVRMRGGDIVLPLTAPVLATSVSTDAVEITTLAPSGPWRTHAVTAVALPSPQELVVSVATTVADGVLVRVIVRGTGSQPVLGTDGVPLAGAVGGPPAGVDDGNDFVLLRDSAALRS